jgi:2,3-diketo-5-methylthio-1-phosphopentane phosphatase
MLFVIDFDGTVSLLDSVDALLERHAPATWHVVEAEWAEGRITAQECMRRQIRMITADDAQLQRFFASIRLDAGFLPFLEHARAFSTVAIVSDGIGRAIHTALETARLPGIPVYANLLLNMGPVWDLEFPNADSACAVGSGTCKCAVAQRLAVTAGGPVVLIGDGRSDMCLAGRADYVFAKGSLARYCDAEAIPYTEFQTFVDLLEVVKAWSMAGGRPAFLDR